MIWQAINASVRGNLCRGDGKMPIIDGRFDLPHRNSAVGRWLHDAHSASSCVPRPAVSQEGLARGRLCFAALARALSRQQSWG